MINPIKIFKEYFSIINYAKQQKKDLNIYPYKILLSYRIIDHLFVSVEQLASQILWIQNKLSNVVVKPKQVFSFWKILGNPAHISENSDSILLYEIYSSIIYHLALVSGLAILERHPSSVDHFTKEQRIYPLGAEALVLYESKDLKIKNNYDFPLKFNFEIKNQILNGSILSTEKIIRNEVVFTCRDFKKFKEVLTRINRRTTDVSVYKMKI
ncbi:hypothetical protein GFU95_01130 [Apibacter sp. B3889]|uniref:VanW family protein n=1 Tax=unclassified Apibacter TaxID=2630820 RepID=UPI001324DF59|nr:MULTISPECIES: VanW family protein [unclassified Apibacter]MXO33617.1 hypothetical protein [Apibacter sp. B3883]MXO40974.1 hypothetical protein [Apibacter sp. B3889]MXP04143.1 hypothetical protein [Apibacter sp. B3887]MXP07046.1 hypothetical protein [Apibacter sp. B3935]